MGRPAASERSRVTGGATYSKAPLDVPVAREMSLIDSVGRRREGGRGWWRRSLERT